VHFPKFIFLLSNSYNKYFTGFLQIRKISNNQKKLISIIGIEKLQVTSIFFKTYFIEIWKFFFTIRNYILHYVVIEKILELLINFFNFIWFECDNKVSLFLH
jgi:hypothetical protein